MRDEIIRVIKKQWYDWYGDALDEKDVADIADAIMDKMRENLIEKKEILTNPKNALDYQRAVRHTDRHEGFNQYRAELIKKWGL